MIIVTGSVTARKETFGEVIAEAKAHVARSRGEDGCLDHSVHIDADNPLRLFFYEEWRDMAALKAHFAVPASGAFVAALQRLCETIEPIQMWNATKVNPG
jgi:quinol monooxygenase YgiN